MNPEIYLLDEPSSNLDMNAIQDLQAHLRLLKAQGKTILIAEHRLYYLMDLADRIVYLDRGCICGIYTPAECRQLPAQRREAMGLRAVDLRSVAPPAAEIPQPSPVLSLEQVRLCHNKQVILEDLNLSAGRGEIIAIVGHNGAGKTTLSRALCGLHKEADGVFRWEGAAVSPKARLKRAYMVMQDVNYELFAESVEAECAFGLRDADAALVAETLAALDLAAYRARHPNTLSGGQKQRLAVAVSMICGKELLVFDEPTSGLDFDSMAQVAALMQQLAAMGKVIFVVTHDYEFVCRSCTRLVQLASGTISDDLAVTADNDAAIRRIFDLEV